MPPKVKVTKEQIVNSALDLVRTSGQEALNARTLAKLLNCSTQPIFSNFASMDLLQTDVIKGAYVIYQGYIQREMERTDIPPYKASGFGYIRFAQEEKQLFRLLFMRDRREECISKDDPVINSVLPIIMKMTGLNRDEAYLFHLEMWIYTHGIATMLATEYLEWDWELISRMMTDAFEGLKHRFVRKE